MSEQIKTGGPAFPTHGWSTNQEVIERMKTQGGMALRDWFAGQAMPQAMARYGPHPQLVAKESFAIADAMIAEREKGNK